MSIEKHQRAPKIVQEIRRYFPEVNRVVDSTQKLEIPVRGSDVKGAKIKDEGECAMARAARRIKGVNGAIIKTTSSYIIKDDVAVRYKTPVSVQREIVSFDRNGDFRPGLFHLAPVSKSQKLGAQRKAPKDRPGKSHHAPCPASGTRIHRRITHTHTEGIRGVGVRPKGD